jgi:hypothetical protein
MAKSLSESRKSGDKGSHKYFIFPRGCEKFAFGLKNILANLTKYFYHLTHRERLLLPSNREKHY